MFFTPISKYEAKAYSHRTNQMSTVFISIYTPHDEPNKLVPSEANRIQAVHFAEFADVDNKHQSAMSKKDALDIALFVKEWNGHVDGIVVQCDAGVSRSAGVCAAIMKYLTGDDEQIFGNGFYKPNMHCYRTMLEAMYEIFGD